MANYSCLYSTFVNLYYNPKNVKNLKKKKKKKLKKNYVILLVFMLVIKCFFSYLKK
jgi:hypothetical protein